MGLGEPQQSVQKRPAAKLEDSRTFLVEVRAAVTQSPGIFGLKTTQGFAPLPSGATSTFYIFVEFSYINW